MVGGGSEEVVEEGMFSMSNTFWVSSNFLGDWVGDCCKGGLIKLQVLEELLVCGFSVVNICLPGPGLCSFPLLLSGFLIHLLDFLSLLFHGFYCLDSGWGIYGEGGYFFYLGCEGF